MSRYAMMALLSGVMLFSASAGMSSAPSAEARCAPVARLTEFVGQVGVRPAGKVARVTPYTVPFPLCEGDEVVTLDGMARLGDGDYTAALDRHSRVRIEAKGASLGGGKVLFDVRKQGPASGVQIKTRLSVIGVKGTSFLVSDDGRELGVAMDSGAVEITSTQGPVGLYREPSNGGAASSTDLQAEYDRFLREKAAGLAEKAAAFEAYKATTQREFVAYVESLTLAARRELITQGPVAVERDLSADTVATIARLRGAF